MEDLNTCLLMPLLLRYSRDICMKMNTTNRTWKHTSFSFYHFIFTYFFLFLRLMLIHFGSFFLKFIGIFGDLKNELTVVHLFLFNWMRCMHPYIKLSLFWIFHSIQKFGVNLNQFRIVIKIFIFSSPRTTNQGGNYEILSFN